MCDTMLTGKHACVFIIAESPPPSHAFNVSIITSFHLTLNVSHLILSFSYDSILMCYQLDNNWLICDRSHGLFLKMFLVQIEFLHLMEQSVLLEEQIHTFLCLLTPTQMRILSQPYHNSNLSRFLKLRL